MAAGLADVFGISPASTLDELSALEQLASRELTHTFKDRPKGILKL
jgi:hypothetical protein